ncbi:MAG: SpoIIE family protein phosphatase [Calditerrivibrio sp.]|nr:SpoIIE family protein phosphatase [Calditerrivibrio sp.]
MLTLHNELALALISETKTDFIKHLEKYLSANNIKKYIIWDITNKIATINSATIDTGDLTFCDLIDLNYYNDNKTVCFTNGIEIYTTFFLEHKDNILLGLSICEEVEPDIINPNLITILSSKLYDLNAAEVRTSIFIEYQKKIDFIKRSSNILKLLDFESIYTKSLSFFMDIFESQAGFLIHQGEFYSIGLTKENIKDSIFISDEPLLDYINRIEHTEFVENELTSDKYLINNMFLIFEEKLNLKIALFNISTHFYPDKEFSEIVSHITSIAIENAINHQRELTLKLEENEMKTTADILNRFVKKEIEHSCNKYDIFGVSYPAKQAGGDFLSIVNEDEHIMVCLADVCGKGYSAAVITVAMSTIFELYTGFNIKSPSNFAQYLSHFLLNKNLDGRFVTLFVCCIDKSTNIMSYISLGHEPIFIRRNDQILQIPSEYMPAGIIIEDYKEKTFPLETGDHIFIYSDGLVEYTDYDDIQKILSSSKSSPKEFIKNLYHELVTDKDHQMDDFTCIKIVLKG